MLDKILKIPQDNTMPLHQQRLFLFTDKKMANLSKKYAMSQFENSAKISIVVPTLNEEENIVGLIKRINEALKGLVFAYEIIFIDDHSADRTREIIKSLENDYPVFCYLKKGKRGKAHSLLEGFSHAQYEN